MLFLVYKLPCLDVSKGISGLLYLCMSRGWDSHRLYTPSCDYGQNPSQAKNLAGERTNSDDKGTVDQ